MKKLRNIFNLLLLISLLISCDKEKVDYHEQHNGSEYQPIDLTIAVGQKDYCEYYTYEPALSFAPQKNFHGRYENHHSINLDNDNVLDFALVRIENIDTSNNRYNYNQEIIIKAYNDFQASVQWGEPDYYDSTENYFSASWSSYYLDTLELGTTICDTCLMWGNESSLIDMETVTNQDGSSNTTIKGIWNEFNKDKYFGFVRTYPDTIIGWVRMELQTEGNLIVIKDCGIKRKGVKYD